MDITDLFTIMLVLVGLATLRIGVPLLIICLFKWILSKLIPTAIEAI